MAFPPLDGREAVRTLECGNAGLQGEHPQKRVRNGEIQDRAGAWSRSGRVLGHRHPGAVTELLRAWGDGDDGALGRVLAEGCSRRYSEVAPDTPVWQARRSLPKTTSARIGCPMERFWRSPTSAVPFASRADARLSHCHQREQRELWAAVVQRGARLRATDDAIRLSGSPSKAGS